MLKLQKEVIANEKNYKKEKPKTQQTNPKIDCDGITLWRKAKTFITENEGITVERNRRVNWYGVLFFLNAEHTWFSFKSLFFVQLMVVYQGGVSGVVVTSSASRVE